MVCDATNYFPQNSWYHVSNVLWKGGFVIIIVGTESGKKKTWGAGQLSGRQKTFNEDIRFREWYSGFYSAMIVKIRDDIFVKQ